MKNLLTTLLAIICCLQAESQRLIKTKEQTYKTTKDLEIEGQSGFLEVPENRNNPDSRTIKIKYIWLKSIAEKPEVPTVFIAGGSGQSTWEAESPEDLTYWIELLEVSDLIFVDRGGENDKSLIHLWKNDLPEDVLVTEEAAEQHYQQMVAEALPSFKAKGVDVRGYNIEEHANDINDLMTALGIERYSIFGFSFGSHIGMTAMKLFPDRIERAVLSGPDAPNQAFNFPRYLDQHVELISEMVKKDSLVNQEVPDFKALVDRVMKKLKDNPVTVEVKNPINRKKMKVKVGAFGMAVILRLDIDDIHDIPVLPRLFYTIDQGDYSALTYFVQRRIVFSMAVPGSGINQYLVSGASDERWAQIEKEADESIFGNVVNFPFSGARGHWLTDNPSKDLSFDSSLPITSDIPTLFITGMLDCRTPVAQVEETMQGFSDATHIKVKGAGHELAHWQSTVSNEYIPAFLRGQEVAKTQVTYSKIKFIKVTGSSDRHPSLK